MPLPPKDTDREDEVGAGAGGMEVLLGILQRAIPIPVVGARGLGLASCEQTGDDKELQRLKWPLCRQSPLSIARSLQSRAIPCEHHLPCPVHAQRDFFHSVG